MARLVIDGYGQVELNNVAFRRDGRIEAQYAPATAFGSNVIENGMLLAVDAVNRELTYATDSSKPVVLVYSAEHMYDERTPGLKNFKLNAKDDFLPRCGYLAVGDKWTENCISYNTASFSDESTFISALGAIKTTPLFGGVSGDGSIAVSASAPTFGPVLQVIEKTTMPDGTLGVKFQVIAD